MYVSMWVLLFMTLFVCLLRNDRRWHVNIQFDKEKHYKLTCDSSDQTQWLHKNKTNKYYCNNWNGSH